VPPTVLVADGPLAAPPRRSRRDRSAWLALALLLHFLVFAALVLVLPEEPRPPQTPAPAEVALLFEGGSRPATPAPPSDRVLPSKAPAPIPGLDAETSAASPPPPAAAVPPTPEAAPPLPETPTAPVTPNVPEAAPVPSLEAAPKPAAPSAVPTAPTVAAPSAPQVLPDVAGTVPVPPPAVRPPEPATTANPEPLRPAATPPPPAVASREPSRPRAPRPISRPNPPRVTADGFPTTLMPSFDLSRSASVTRNAAIPPPSAARSNASSDVRGGEALGADWLAELSAYVERHKRYPDQAAQNNEEGDSTISIVVGRDGHVFGRDVDLIRRSGSQFLDMGLLSMFRDKKLPPFPPGAPHDRETIQITMHYYLIRR